MSASIFNGTAVKLLKDVLRFKSGTEIITGDTDDPTSVAKSAPIGSLYIRSGTDDVYVKGDNGSSTNWTAFSTGAGGITQLTSDVTAGPGSGSQAATIANDAVTNAKMANMATQTIKGRTTAGTGDPEDLTATQATAILNSLVGDSGSGGTKGLAPAPSAGDAAANKFLKADGTWSTTPTSSGYAWTVQSKTANYTAVANDYVKVDGTSGGFTITLPTAVGVSGQMIAVDRTDNTLANTITIATTSSQTIDGASNKHCYTQNEKWVFVSDGSNWRVQSHEATTDWNTGTWTTGSTGGGTAPTKATSPAADIFAWRRDGSEITYKFIYAQTSSSGTANGTNNYMITMPTGITFKTSTSQIADTTTTAGRPNTSTVMGTGSQYSAADGSSGTNVVHLYDSTNLVVWFTGGTGQWWGTNTATSSYKLASGNEIRVMLSGSGIHANWED